MGYGMVEAGRCGGRSLNQRKQARNGSEEQRCWCKRFIAQHNCSPPNHQQPRSRAELARLSGGCHTPSLPSLLAQGPGFESPRCLGFGVSRVGLVSHGDDE